LATTHVHANCCRIYIPKSGWRSAGNSGRHTIHFHKSRNALASNAVPFGFCCGGFSSTAGLRAQQRGSRVRRLRATFGYLKVDQFLEARLRFYPLPLVESLATFPRSPSLSASARGVIAATAACCYSQTMRHRISLPIPSLVTTPVSTATRMWVIRSALIQVKQKIL
jgi:hypothetical protein